MSCCPVVYEGVLQWNQKRHRCFKHPNKFKWKSVNLGSSRRVMCVFALFMSAIQSKWGCFHFSDTFWFSRRVVMVCCWRWPSFFTSHTSHLSCGAPSSLPPLLDLSHTGPKYLSSLAVHCACSDFCSINSKTRWFKGSLKPRHTSPTICHLGLLGAIEPGWVVWPIY